MMVTKRFFLPIGRQSFISLLLMHVGIGDILEEAGVDGKSSMNPCFGPCLSRRTYIHCLTLTLILQKF